MTESKSAEARSPMETELGFRIEVRDGGEAGSVVWIGKTAVRPATGVEIALWQMLLKRDSIAGVLAETVKDPFGTPKEERQSE